MIDDLNEFEKLLKICRKQGVKTIQVGAVNVSFGDMPRKRKEDETSDTDIATEELTQEQMMFYSSGGAGQ